MDVRRDPALTWREIQTRIKGGRTLSREDYLELRDWRCGLLTREERTAVYDLYA
jgi:hypothetical protein